MSSLEESCSICGASFEVRFRYQMEEKEGGFSFFCSQKCLEQSQTEGREGLATCDACAKRFRVDLVSQVLYVEGKRHYACSPSCRSQLVAESRGTTLGQLSSMDAPRGQSEGEQDSARPATAPVARTSAQAIPLVASPTPTRLEKTPPTEQRAHIFAIFNHKGGTGKTTTSVSVAAGLAEAGHKVLLVDTDAQGNVAVSLNIKSERSLYHVLVMGLAPKAVTQTVRNNLDVIASNETLAATELYLAGRQNRDRLLRERLSKAVGDYDYIILDCSPSLSLLNQNALVFADNVLIPVACDYLSLVGVRQVLKTIRNVNQLLHHPVKLWGVLPTLYDARANICHEAVTTLQQHFGERCLAPIRTSIRVKEAPAHGQTIYEHAEGTTAADDYRGLVDRIVRECSEIRTSETRVA